MTTRPYVAGVDTSTQSCKVVIVDPSTGHVIREGKASHPDGTEVDPAAWWEAFLLATSRAGGFDDVAALSVGGQQHGMVCLDAAGGVIRPALLWNDTRSAEAAEQLMRTHIGHARALWATGLDEAVNTSNTGKADNVEVDKSQESGASGGA